jgi:dGTPase
MTKTYANLLKTDRPRPSAVEGRTIMTESESDRGRILFCAAFRRLQQKAQVFSMEPNAAVRSRLTHSLEVSQVGRYIADQISIRLEARGMAEATERVALVTFVESACLMHDIGNPPFGHFGEAAIKKWFDDNGALALQKACAPYGPNKNGSADPRLDSALADFLEFDGNPQGLRVVTKLQWNKDPHGLNLTKTTLAAYLKYVRMAGEKIAAGVERNFVKKAGYFCTEKELVDDIWKFFGYESGQRFPLAYIMEAADDIAYCISDLEDSIEKELLGQSEAIGAIKDEWLAAHKIDGDIDKKILKALECAASGRDGDQEFTFTDFRTTLTRAIVDYVADQYIENHSDVIGGTLKSLLPEGSGAGEILNTLKSYCKRKVYCHESVQRTELAGYTAIYGLLDHFKILLGCSVGRFECALDYSKNVDEQNQAIVIEKKYLRLFPQKYIKVYCHTVCDLRARKVADFEFHEWNARAHLIVDFISGMTDDFAMTTYQNLSGMRL